MKSILISIALTITTSISIYSQSITPDLNNWNIKPKITLDSQNDTSITNSLSLGKEFAGSGTISALNNRTFTFNLPALAAGGMLTYSIVSDISNVTVESYTSNNGTDWTLYNSANYHNGRGDDLQKVDIPASTSSDNWFKVIFKNTGSSAKTFKELGLYKFSATGKNQYFLVVGASLTESSGNHSAWKKTIRERISNSLNPVIFNWSISGDNTQGLKDKIDNYLSKHPNASYVMLEIGGNDVTPNRPLTYFGSLGTTYTTMNSNMKYILQKIVAANKIPVVSRISFRNYLATTSWQGFSLPAVNGGLNQEYGSLPYNFDMDTLIKKYSPAFWNDSEKRGYIDWYQMSLNNQSWLLSSDGTHFYGSETFHIRDFWVDYAYKYIYTGARSPIIPYKEIVTNIVTNATTAVQLAENSPKNQNFWNARILVEQIANTTTRLSLFSRISAAEKGVYTPQIITQPLSINVPEGNSATFSIVASSAATINYQWYKNDVLISGATASSYTFTAALTDQASSYKCIASNSYGSITSQIVTINVTAKKNTPVVTQNPANVTVLVGNVATLSISATSSSSMSYQWFKNESSISGAITNIYSFTPTVLDNGATFYCIVSNTDGSTTSSSATLTVSSGVSTGLTARYYTTVYAGFSTNATLTKTDPNIDFAWGTGAPNIGISADAFAARWTGTITPTTSGTYTFYTQTDDGVRLYVNNQLIVDKWVYQGLTEWSGSITLVAGTSYNFKMEFFEGNGNATCKLLWSSPTISKQTIPTSVFLPEGATVVATAPTINIAPANNTVLEGSTATFTATASSSLAITYQWTKNGSNIVGATSSTYTITATNADNGSSIACKATNSVGTTTSNIANLVVTPIVAPTINITPTNATIFVGSTVTFTATANSSVAFTYQWTKNGTNILGATTSIFSFIAKRSDSASSFVCVATNSAGSTTSNVATILVERIVAPEIVSDPTYVNVSEGSIASFTTTAIGSEPLTYQWTKNGTNIIGATNSSYSFTTVLSDSGSVFTCIVSNSAGNATSAPALLSVKKIVIVPTITQNPINTSISSGSLATFSISATGSASLLYQWHKNGIVIPGANSTSYSFTATIADNNSSYYCKVSNTAGIVNSTSATLFVSSVVNGLTAKFYKSVSSAFTSSVALSRTDANINNAWGNGSPDALITTNYFSARWTGKITVPVTGTYTFYTYSDDGVKLSINNVLLVDKWVYQPLTEWSATITLTAGVAYNFRMDYFEGNGDATCKLFYSSATISKQIVPSSFFTPESTTNAKTDDNESLDNSITIEQTTIHPNPFTEQLEINYLNEDASIENLNISIFDTKGLKIYNIAKPIEIGTNMIKLNPNLQPGIYILSVGDEKFRIVYE